MKAQTINQMKAEIDSLNKQISQTTDGVEIYFLRKSIEMLVNKILEKI